MSSPQINNLIIAGCILSYTSVLLMGVDSTLLGKISSESAMNFICAVRFVCSVEIVGHWYFKGAYLDFINWFYYIIWSYI
jgi:hypothetical protein